MRREDTERQADTQRKSCGYRHRDQSDAATRQRMLRIARSHQKPRRGKEGLFPRGF